MARIGIAIEEPPQSSSPEVVHILKKIGLQPDATIEQVRSAMRNPDNFAALGQVEPIILARHFGKPIEAGDDMEVGSKLDGLQGDARDAIDLILAQKEKDALGKLRVARNTVKPDGGARSDHLVKLLTAMDAAGQNECDTRRAKLVERLRALSEQY